jgi:hypothetical protein
MAVADTRLDVQVFEMIVRLRAANNDDAATLLDHVHTRLEHTQCWYGSVHERLWHWAHEELNDQQRERFFSIVANGTAAVNEPPSYAQQFNMMKWRMKRAEAELATLKEETGKSS